MFCIEHSLLLTQVANERLSVGITEQTKKEVDLVENEQFDMRLHPNAVNQPLLFLNERVVVVAADLLDCCHLHALLRLLDRLLHEVEHLFQSLHAEVELGRPLDRLNCICLFVVGRRS